MLADHHMNPKSAKVELFLIESGPSHCHPFLLTVAPLVSCCFLLMEISPPPSFSFCHCPHPLLCYLFVVLHSTFTFQYLPCASSLARSLKLIVSVLSLRALHLFRFPAKTNQSAFVDYLTHAPSFSHYTVNQQMINNKAQPERKQIGFISECGSGRQEDWVSFSEA